MNYKQEKNQFIEKERFNLYMDEMLRNYIGSIFIGLPLFYFIFQSHATLTSTKLWFLFDAILLASVSLTYYLFYKHKDKFSLSTLRHISDVPVILFSLHIAAAPWLWLQSEVEIDIYLYTLFIMIISLTGTITQAISYYFERQILFSALPILSLVIKFYSTVGINHIEIYLVVILVWVGLIAYAHRIHKSLISSINLKFDNIQARSNAERANKQKSYFLAAASHDIRQPLQAVNLLVSSLKSNNENPENILLLQRLESSVDSMSDLLNSLLDVSKLDADSIVPKPQHICIKTLIEKLHSEFKPLIMEKNLELAIQINSDIVIADPILLEQVLTNLLSNAIRYTSFGKITVLVEDELDDVMISIHDSGIGIDEANQEAIFLEFFQLDNPERDSKKGLGLGLSIVKRLCSLQDWPLTLSSKLGEGSCFCFKMPKGLRELVQVTTIVNMNKNLNKIDVIVIDDHEGIRFSLSNMLKNWGCNVKAFESNEDTCLVIEQSPNWQPNLIISDYRLLNNTTGVEAIKQIISKLGYPLEAIIISGDTAPERINEIESNGLRVIHKPIKPAKLRVIITRLMKSAIEG